MKYPKMYTHGKEPVEIRVGDLVWWSEGQCVGFIEEVLESREDYEHWGLEEPCIALTNLHPFDANQRKHKQHIGGIMNGGTVMNSADQLDREGVGLLSVHERGELEWVIAEARARVAAELRDAPFCVSAIWNPEREGEDWRIDFVDQRCAILATEVIPFRPDTRTRQGSSVG